MANPAPTINQINAFNATQGTTIDFNIIGGTELIRSNRIYIYDLSDNSLICTHLYVSTESIHELPPNTDGSIVYESGKSSADFVNGAQYYAQIQTYTDTNGTQGGSGLSVAKMFWCLGDPTLTITTIPSTISTTSYNVSATYTDTSASVVSNIIQQYQFNLYSATGSLLQSSGVVVGGGTQQGTSAVYDISHNFTGLNVGSSYYVTVDVTTTQGMSVTTQSNTFTVSIDTPTLGEATVVNNACDGYISVTSNLSGEYGGSGSGEIVSFETDSENVFSKLQVELEPIQEGSGNPSPSNVRPIRGRSGVTVYDSPTQNAEDGESYSVDFNATLTPTSTDTTPYLFKAVGDVYGDRLEDKIVGGTVAWNQLVKELNATNWIAESGATISFEDDVIVVSSTKANNGAVSVTHPTFKNGHKYLVISKVKTETDLDYVVIGSAQYSGVSKVASIQAGQWVDNSYVAQSVVDGTVPLYCYAQGIQYSNLRVKDFMIFDLTQMFGSTIADYIYSLEQSQAGAGVAWFKKLFPNDYYAYNAGELLSVEGLQSHDAVGFNQFDKDNPSPVIHGYIDNTSMSIIGAGNHSIYYIPCLPNTEYCASRKAISTNDRFGIADMDDVPEVGGTINGYSLAPRSQVVGNDIVLTLTTGANAKYLAIWAHWVNETDGTEALDTLCINLSNPSRNGEYEPYEKHSYPLDSSLTLRGIPKLDASNNLYYDGDEYTSDGKVKRNTILRAYQSGDESLANAITDGTNTVVYSANASTETAEPYTNPQIVSKYGTLEYVTNSIVPVGHKTTYLTRDIFGGYVDLISGTLVVDKVMVDMGSLNWTLFSASRFWVMPSGMKPFTRNLMSSQYAKKYVGVAELNDGEMTTQAGAGEVYVKDTRYTTATEFKSAVSGQQLVYELATPQTYQLTPQQVYTLVGTNNVWSEQGNIELSYHFPITNLLVKRQDVDDVSGGWLTLYSQPISQASDMDFTFIDFLNQYGKTYKYALVPLLTQTQSGVEVEVEGGYTVSDEVQSVFDGVFIADSTGSQKCKANVGYGNVDMNQVVGSITPIGAKYPIIITNSHNQYHNGSISGTIVPDDYYFNGNLSRIDMVKKRNELEQFLTNKRVKVIKDWNGNIWLVMIMGNVSCTFNNTYGMGIVDFSTNWTEVGDPTNQEDLQATGLINVGCIIMPNQKQFDTTLQSIRNIDCKLFVLDYDYTILDEISGKTESISLSVNAESDIRRTANINIALKDDSRQTNSNIFYWQVGNPYWFDKYIQIYVAIQDVQTQEYVWVNEGIYMVNSPTISYDATSNSLSFEAVDLMSKMTGLRNGQLEGMTYTIPVGSTITGAIKTLLVEQGFDNYIVFDPPYNYVPQEINIDVGGTAYDLLCQLRDINSNWEMFFDVDGVFHFQQIPSGKVIIDPESGEEGEPTPVVDQTVWDKLNVSYNLDTNFEDVKNYVEVLGKVHEPNEYGTAKINDELLNLNLANVKENYLNNEWIIGIPVIATEGAIEPEALTEPINRIVIKDIANVDVADINLSSPIIAANEYYCVKLTFNDTECTACEYLGALQSRAIAFENNPDSPFYVGTSTQYESAYGNVVDFASENEDYIAELPITVSGSNIGLNLSPWCTASDFSAASVGTTWKFKLSVESLDQYITTMSITIGGTVEISIIRNMANERISLDYAQDYLLIVTKISSTTLQFNVMYYPMPASVLPMSTTSVLNLPKFNKQVRVVCAGDEYDNIYSDALAEQRARYEIYLRSRLHDNIQIVSAPIYWLEVNNIIEYNLPNSNSEESDLWLIKSINTDVSPNGTQSISATRYYPLYADISMASLRMSYDVPAPE